MIVMYLLIRRRYVQNYVLEILSFHSNKINLAKNIEQTCIVYLVLHTAKFVYVCIYIKYI